MIGTYPHAQGKVVDRNEAYKIKSINPNDQLQLLLWLEPLIVTFKASTDCYGNPLGLAQDSHW